MVNHRFVGLWGALWYLTSTWMSENVIFIVKPNPLPLKWEHARYLVTEYGEKASSTTRSIHLFFSPTFHHSKLGQKQMTIRLYDKNNFGHLG